MAGLFLIPVIKAEILLDHNDQELLVQATRGKQDAFGALYERYVHRIYNYIYYRTGNQHDAEDLTARVFIRAMRHITNYEDKGVPFSAWLYRIAHNLVANWHRDNSRRQEISLDDGYTQPGEKGHPEVVLLDAEAQDTLLKYDPKIAGGPPAVVDPEIRRQAVERGDRTDDGPHRRGNKKSLPPYFAHPPR